VKAALIALVLSVAGPVHLHLHLSVFGLPVSVPVAWLILVIEVTSAAVLAWLIVRRRFRSAPWPRPAGATA
jgi:hypothetical protein